MHFILPLLAGLAVACATPFVPPHEQVQCGQAFCIEMVVCGSDGQQYGRPCDAECKGLTTKPKGKHPCPASCPLDRCPDLSDSCTCVDAPVCGKDGITHSGPCSALCAGLKPGEWSKGKCKEEDKKEDKQDPFSCGCKIGCNEDSCSNSCNKAHVKARVEYNY